MCTDMNSTVSRREGCLLSFTPPPEIAISPAEVLKYQQNQFASVLSGSLAAAAQAAAMQQRPTQDPTVILSRCSLRDPAGFPRGSITMGKMSLVWGHLHENSLKNVFLNMWKNRSEVSPERL